MTSPLAPLAPLDDSRTSPFYEPHHQAWRDTLRRKREREAAQLLSEAVWMSDAVAISKSRRARRDAPQLTKGGLYIINYTTTMQRKAAERRMRKMERIFAAK